MARPRSLAGGGLPVTSMNDLVVEHTSKNAYTANMLCLCVERPARGQQRRVLASPVT